MAPQEAGVNKATQGSVHSAFYNGYTLTQARARAARLLRARKRLGAADASPRSPRGADPGRLGRLALRG